MVNHYFCGEAETGASVATVLKTEIYHHFLQKWATGWLGYSSKTQNSHSKITICGAEKPLIFLRFNPRKITKTLTRGQLLRYSTIYVYSYPVGNGL
jgi:hypothetical protein